MMGIAGGVGGGRCCGAKAQVEFAGILQGLKIPFSSLSSLLVAAGVFGLLLTPVGAQVHAGAGTYGIAGTVVNALSGEPVPGATVAVQTEEDSRVAAVECGNDGRFALEGLPAAKYKLSASKRGYLTAAYDAHEEFSSAIVTGAGQDTSHLVFKLVPGAVLHGVVSGDGGDGVEGAKVMLFHVPRALGHDNARARGPLKSIELVETVSTDDTGSYEFDNPKPGEYLVAVAAEPWYALHRAVFGTGQGAKAEGGGLDVAYPLTFFDSTTEEASAVPIEVTGGSRIEANISLHAVPALHLAVEAPHKQDGSVVRPELKQSVFGTEIPAETTAALDSLQTESTEFTGVAPGHYVLWQGDPPRVAELDATVSQQVDGRAGAAAVAVQGTLRLGPGQLLEDDADVALYLMDGPLHLNPLTGKAVKGRFRIEGVAPGVWELFAWSGGHLMPTLTVAVNGVIHAGGTFTVGERPLAVAATVAPGEARVEGFVQKAGRGFAGALVVLAPKNRVAFDSLVVRDQSDSDGSFSLQHVTAGQYTLVAIEGAWDLADAGIEALGRYLPGGVAVTVTGTGEKVLRLSEPVQVQPR